MDFTSEDQLTEPEAGLEPEVDQGDAVEGDAGRSKGSGWTDPSPQP